jgi:hypothetical protein
MDNMGKVLPLRDPKNYSIFNPNLRRKLEDSVTGFTEKPSETITAVERAGSDWLVEQVRKWAVKLGERAGEKVGQALANR